MGLNKLIPFECSFCVKVEGHDHIKALNVVKEGDVIQHLRPLTRVCQRSAPAFAGMQGVLRYNNSTADKDLSAVDWRRRWDSNPRALSDNRISSAARYDHFDTSPRALRVEKSLLPCYYTRKRGGCQALLSPNHGNQFCARRQRSILGSSKESNISLDRGRLEAVLDLYCLIIPKANLRSRFIFS